MIHKLSGMHETADYRQDTQLVLYHNVVSDDFPPHWHTPFEILMPLKNGYRAKCSNQDYELREGDILIICPGIIHELYAPPSGERIIFQVNLSPVNLKELDILVSSIRPTLLITPEDYPDFYDKAKQLILEISDEYDRADSYYETALYARVLYLLVELGRRRMPSNRTISESDSIRHKDYIAKFKFLTEYISAHFAEDLTLDTIADLAGFSKYHFTRLFKQYTDTTFYKYLNNKRIDHAKTLLLEPDLTITEISSKCGFTSLSAFLRVFKQYTSCTPTEFREMYDRGISIIHPKNSDI